MFDLVVRGELVLPNGIVRGGRVAVKDGRIAGVFAPGVPEPQAREVVDASGSWVLPGAIDAHVHAFSFKDSDGFRSLTRSAAWGGVTTVIDMPYDTPHPVTGVQRLQEKLAALEAEAIVDVALYGTVPKRGGVAAVAPLAAAGVAGFKLSLYETDPYRFPRIPDDELLSVLPAIRDAGRVALFHAENGEIVDSLVAALQSQGHTEPRAHGESRPPLTETVAIAKLLELAWELRAPVHVVHVTVPRGFALVDQYRRWGADVTAETCIQYLVLSEEDMPRLGAFGKVNPPLRSPEFQERLWQEIMEGRVDLVTSDHVAWPRAVKSHADIFANSSGMPGVGLLLPLLFSEGVVRRGMSVNRLTQLLSEGPARRFGLYPQKGAIQPGADADLAILDPSVTWTFRTADDPGAPEWSAYDGMTITGRVVRTIVRGRTVYDETGVRAGSGGRFVRPAE